MVNTLEEGGNELVNSDYSHLLTTILKVLQDPQQKSLFSKSTNSNNGKRLFINIDEIAERVASSSIENPLGSQGSSAKSATFNLNKASQSAFLQQVQQIRECLKQQIEAAIGEGEQQVSIEQYIEEFAQKLSKFTGELNSSLGLEYPFRTPYKGLQKQRLSLNKKTSNASPLLRGHKLTIAVNNTHRFQEQLKASLENFIKTEFSSDDEQKELNFILEDLIANPKSEFYNLQRLVDVEALGKLQREAKIRYLEYLEEHIGEHKDIIYLADLIRRLRLLEEYINDEEKEDGHYEVNYQGVSVNYRTIFSRAEAYDDLPIIPVIEGYLGEIKDEYQGKQQFIFGIKLKLNGQVQTENGITAFDYRLDLIDPNSKNHQEKIADSHQKNRFAEKVLKIALLYYFIFAGDDPNLEGYKPQQDLEYDPINNFETKVLPILQGSDENKKARILAAIKKGLTDYQVVSKIQKLKNLLTDALCRNSSMKTRNYPLHVSINRGILDDDFRKISDRSSFFKEVITTNQKQALKYISVEEATANPNALCTLPGSIQINDIQYFATKDSQTFSMEYDDVSSISTIPVVVSPENQKCSAIYEGDNLGKYNILGFLYNRERLLNNHFKNIESPEAFTYKITFALLAYISLQILFESSKKGIFIPILRLHLTGKDNPSPEEEFIRSLFLVLSHLLNEKNRSNSQGFKIGNTSSFKIKNGLSSLYCILPKKFKFDNPVEARKIEKLAIVIVSSRESDRSKKGDYKITNLMGEAIAIQHQEKDNSIRLQSYGTFSGNYGSQDIYSHPDCVLDKFNLLYQHGYRHFLYIAKSPYSSTLNMINTEQDKELFFMSKELVKSVRGNKEDMKIYPVFFDRYSVLKIGKPEIDSLYIQDIAELTEIVKDPSKKSVVFFNLFNGITVPGGERYYNGVMSYSTLLNVYDNILDDKDIHLGLIDDGALKRDILQYLTLFHFSRYESPSKKVNLKLNPYQNIIGDDSVGCRSIFTHMKSGVKFNLLSFLTEVRRALNVQPESEDVEECQS